MLSNVPGLFFTLCTVSQEGSTLSDSYGRLLLINFTISHCR